jgi:hypothetical protein
MPGLNSSLFRGNFIFETDNQLLKSWRKSQCYYGKFKPLKRNYTPEEMLKNQGKFPGVDVIAKEVALSAK